jgi:HSP20 family protein
MQEQMRQQHIPVKVYRTAERLMVTTPMPGLEPENIQVEVTRDGHLVLHGEMRGMLKEVKELLLDEWSVGAYYRKLALPVSINAECANASYGNGVLTLAGLNPFDRFMHTCTHSMMWLWYTCMPMGTSVSVPPGRLSAKPRRKPITWETRQGRGALSRCHSTHPSTRS